MRSDERSQSFTFHKIDMSSKSENEVAGTRITRQRLQDRFDKECPYSFKSTKENVRSEKRWTNLNLSSVSLPPIHPRRVLRSGADKLSQTFNNVRTTFGTLSQKFRSSTRRRYRLKNDSPNSPVTPQTRSRYLLGRTPTKLYSPFGIESPYHRNAKPSTSKDKENDMGTGRYTPRRRNTRSSSHISSVSQDQCCRKKMNEHFSMYSPHQKFDSDLEEARIGIWEFDQTANNIVRRSLRH
ncbi:hypothetical protein L9F63_026766 [Diploptera punctata]|uniref:Uncharacterized protein n=1 Tax=Diploptera punctata TaxID=6984 RepID=A0AAD8AFK3_DIPPU|nr:hypothetical protein L9F63_026766 [Diploptera punctata]